MDIAKTFNSFFSSAVEKFVIQVKNELAAQARVSCLKVENLTSDSQRVKVRITFKYGGARCAAWLDAHGFVSDSPFNVSNFSVQGIDIKFDGQQPTVEGMLQAVRDKYVAFLREQVKTIERNVEFDNDAVTVRQRLFMLQQVFVDNGFEAAPKQLANGDWRLVIGHEMIKNQPIREVSVT